MGRFRSIDYIERKRRSRNVFSNIRVDVMT